MSIPLSAIDIVQDNFESPHLHLDQIELENEEDAQMLSNFIANKFTFKLKHDFLSLFLNGSYDQMV
jgi:hypothetical protein